MFNSQKEQPQKKESFVQMAESKNLNFEEKLRQKVAEAEKFLSDMKDNSRPPYELKLTIISDRYDLLCLEVAGLLDDLTTRGPDAPRGSRGGGHADYHKIEFSSGKEVYERSRQFLRSNRMDD